MNKSNIAITLICGLIAGSVNASYRIYAPLEIKNNGRLPDDSIVFVGGNDNTPEVPETPESGSCLYDLGATTLFAEIVDYGDVAQVRFYNGQRISNGVKGEQMLSQGNASYYELCLNGQAPIPYVEETEWGNGECKYNSGLGLDSPRYWSEAYSLNDSSLRIFLASPIGTYENHAYLMNGTPGVVFPSEWTNVNGELVVTTSGRISFNGYQYYKGALKNTREDSNGRDVDFYEVCRTR